MTFPGTAEGKGFDTDFFLIFMGLLMPHKVKADVLLKLPRMFYPLILRCVSV